MSDPEILSPEQVYAQRDRLTVIRPDGLVAHLAGIDGTTFDPPMPIEAINAENEVGGVVVPGPTNPEFGISITAWTARGDAASWMVGISVSTGMNVEVVIQFR